MLDSSHPVVNQILISFVLGIFIVTGIVGIALGGGLILSSARTLRILKRMNRWISLRDSLKPMDKTRDIDKTVYRYRRWTGIVFAAGGAYTVFMLLFAIDFPRVIAELGGTMKPVVLELTVEILRWTLVVGGGLAFVIGAMMLVSAYALPAFDVRVNRWYSSPKLGEGADKMHLTLDNWAETFPRFTGLLLALGSAIVLIAATILWLEN